MSVEVTCGKCGEKITNMKMLKSLKDVMKSYDGKCPSCGQKLSISEFSLDVQENWSDKIYFSILKNLILEIIVCHNKFDLKLSKPI